MKASEFIAKLTTLVAEHGDLYVVNDDDEQVEVEFDSYGDGQVFVVG